MSEKRESGSETSSPPPTEETPKRGRGSRQRGSGPAGRQAKAEGSAAPDGVPDLPMSWGFRGFLVTYVLLLLSAQRAHGYFIEQYLRGLGLLNVELSSLYRTLRQLEGAGLVTSDWEQGPEGPARRVYRLTDAGRWWLDANANVLEGYRTLLDRFFGSYSGQDKGKAKTD